MNTQNKISKEYLNIGENLKKILPKDIVYKLEDSNKLDKFLNQANINNDGMLDEAEFNNFYNKVNKWYKRSLTPIPNNKYFKFWGNYNSTKYNKSNNMNDMIDRAVKTFPKKSVLNKNENVNVNVNENENEIFFDAINNHK